MKTLNKCILLGFVIAAMICISSCDKEDEPIGQWKDGALCQKLIGTSWQLYLIVDYWNDGSIADQSERLRPQIYSFTDKIPKNNFGKWDSYEIEMRNINDNSIQKGSWCLDGNYLWSSVSPSIMGEIISISSSELQLKFEYDNPEGCGCDYSIDYYRRVNL